MDHRDIEAHSQGKCSKFRTCLTAYKLLIVREALGIRIIFKEGDPLRVASVGVPLHSGRNKVWIVENRRIHDKEE